MKKREYQSPCVFVQTLLVNHELLSASQVYDGELNSPDTEESLFMDSDPFTGEISGLGNLLK